MEGGKSNDSEKGGRGDSLHLFVYASMPLGSLELEKALETFCQEEKKSNRKNFQRLPVGEGDLFSVEGRGAKERVNSACKGVWCGTREKISREVEIRRKGVGGGRGTGKLGVSFEVEKRGKIY